MVACLVDIAKFFPLDSGDHSLSFSIPCTEQNASGSFPRREPLENSAHHPAVGDPEFNTTWGCVSCGAELRSPLDPCHDQNCDSLPEMLNKRFRHSHVVLEAIKRSTVLLQKEHRNRM